jgi:cell wall-associated NlpC family hydrolase
MNQNFRPYIENALKWAEEQLDSEAYPFRCLAFVEDAYEISNGIEIFGGSSAKESAEEYGTQTMPLIPPRGTFVFYDCFGLLFETYQNWGHVGLSLGDGQVIHAWNKVRLDHYLEIEQLAAVPGWTQPHYLGWTPVERIFLGYRQKS